MKICLNVNADSVNVLALNMGRMAVEIDGIELSELTEAVNRDGFTLHVTDEQELIPPFPPAARLKGIQCSTAHLSDRDVDILDRASLPHSNSGNDDWILNTGYGFLLRLSARSHPVLTLRRMGLSKTCRLLITTLMKRHGITFLHFDAAGELWPGFHTFDG